MKIYFVRHGHTKNNKDKIITGQLDDPLNEEGVEEAISTEKE
jgi:broad specificity phosphatase PhoE